MPPPPPLPPYVWAARAVRPVLFYLTDHRDADRALARLPLGPLGFDLEWRPCFRKGQPENPVALVQLAAGDTVLLFHIHFMKQFPQKLAELLGSPSHVKAGVSIQYDCAKLYRDYRVSVRNCVDLSLLARTVDNARWKGRYTNPLGLARLLETYERATLLKGRIQRSNWELPLTPSQQQYAANDAHAGYVVHSRLMSMAQVMDPAPLPAYYSFSLVDGHLRDHSGVVPWHAHNPHYDPGPPPPPKPQNADNVDQIRSDPPPPVASKLPDGA